MNIHLRWWDDHDTLCGAEVERLNYAEAVSFPSPAPTPMRGLHCKECLRIYYAEEIIWVLKKEIE
jgi:hypothetical protein